MYAVSMAEGINTKYKCPMESISHGIDIKTEESIKSQFSPKILSRRLGFCIFYITRRLFVIETLNHGFGTRL